MAKLSKKAEKEIRSIGLSVFQEVLQEYNPNPQYNEDIPVWYDSPPEEWNKEEKQFWDSLSELQIRMTNKIIEFLSNGK